MEAEDSCPALNSRSRFLSDVVQAPTGLLQRPDSYLQILRLYVRMLAG